MPVHKGLQNCCPYRNSTTQLELEDRLITALKSHAPVLLGQFSEWIPHFICLRGYERAGTNSYSRHSVKDRVVAVELAAR